MVSFVSYMLGSRGRSGFGSTTTAEEVASGIALNSQVAIITGTTSGIGFETARVLAKQGAHVVLPARKIKDAEGVKAKITKEFPDATVTVGELDLSSLSSVRKFVADFKALNLPLNILINNAGIQTKNFTLSPDGLEMDFATNHMGHFLLVELLLDDMIKTASETGLEGRIVNVASVAHKIPPFRDTIIFDKLNDKDSFNWMRAYGRSKLANILHAKELAMRLQERKANVTVNAIHPGTINTNLPREHGGKFVTDLLFTIGKPFFKNIPQGAATTVYAAIHPSLKGISGKYYSDCNEDECNEWGNDMNLAAELHKYSQEFVKNRLS